jgi:hypothetical protein
MMSQTASARTRLMTVSLVMTRSGPQVYQWSATKTDGWTLGTDVFVNQLNDDAAMGPIQRRAPLGRPVVQVALFSAGEPRVAEWIAPGSAWMAMAVVFLGPNNHQAGVGSQIVILPTPRRLAPIRRIFTLPAR